MLVTTPLQLGQKWKDTPDKKVTQITKIWVCLIIGMIVPGPIFS